MAKPVTLFGKTYKSMAAASRAFGCENSAVQQAYRQNRLDIFGVGSGRRRFGVTDGKTVYCSVYDAAKYLSVSEQKIYRLIQRGVLQKIPATANNQVLPATHEVIFQCDTLIEEEVLTPQKRKTKRKEGHYHLTDYIVSGCQISIRILFSPEYRRFKYLYWGTYIDCTLPEVWL